MTNEKQFSYGFGGNSFDVRYVKHPKPRAAENVGLQGDLIMDDAPPEDNPPSPEARLTLLESKVNDIVCELRTLRLEMQIAIQTAVQAAVDKLEKRQDKQFRWLMTLLVTILVCVVGLIAAVAGLAATVWQR